MEPSSKPALWNSCIGLLQTHSDAKALLSQGWPQFTWGVHSLKHIFYLNVSWFSRCVYTFVLQTLMSLWVFECVSVCMKMCVLQYSLISSKTTDWILLKFGVCISIIWFMCAFNFQNRCFYVEQIILILPQNKVNVFSWQKNKYWNGSLN